MNKEFINYEQSLALKELGFDEPCFGRWIEPTQLSISAPADDEYCQKQHEFSWVALAPLYQQAFSFFREKHKLIAYPQWRIDNTWDITIQQLDGYGLLSGQTTLSVIKKSTYEEAEQACLDKLIKIVKNGNK